MAWGTDEKNKFEYSKALAAGLALIALAGGATPNGDPNKVDVFRDGVKLTTLLNANTTIAESPIRSGDQIVVAERSWLR